MVITQIDFISFYSELPFLFPLNDLAVKNISHPVQLDSITCLRYIKRAEIHYVPPDIHHIGISCHHYAHIICPTGRHKFCKLLLRFYISELITINILTPIMLEPA